MRSKENSLLSNAGKYDIRKTAVEWFKQIGDLKDSNMIFIVAEALSEANLVKEEEYEGGLVCNISNKQIMQHALERYMLLQGVDDLLEKVKGKDSLGLKLGTIDVLLKKRNRNLKNIRALYIFLNAYRDFLPSELLKTQIKKVHTFLQELQTVGEIKGNNLEAVAGVIDIDD